MSSVVEPGCSGASRSGGFTLIELLVTVAVLAVVLGLAVPSFQGIIQRNRLTAAANELVAAVQLARAEAIRRNRQVVLCPTLDGAACSGSNWMRTIVRVPSSNEVVREFLVTGSGISITGSANVAANSQIAFNPNGLVRVGGGNDTSGVLSVCSSRVTQAENTRDVQIAVSRVSVEVRDGGAGCASAQVQD
ncbi:GspH/FimT family pseudopilin [Arenimonas fontis]|uniref:Type II secretion system protein H n=1 Tax=Arenimonas fontis TaxID=2608255 RepID=A0A5B2Z6U2_9GAMM|nr:GspH/FimT family pseudopilin [Arenimonas fontis]KAA2283916.1 prepilin-type N-terminal cleavage/methylation domain-containing protein [Arenimonas fontis]